MSDLIQERDRAERAVKRAYDLEGERNYYRSKHAQMQYRLTEAQALAAHHEAEGLAVAAALIAAEREVARLAALVPAPPPADTDAPPTADELRRLAEELS